MLGNEWHKLVQQAIDTIGHWFHGAWWWWWRW